MSLLLQVLVSGLAAGAVYGLVAVALVLVYRLTGIVYFAFGDLVGLAVFAALLVAAGTGPVTQTSVGAGRFLVAGGRTAVCIATSAGAYWLAVHPHLERGSVVGWIAATVAIAYAVRTSIDVFFTRPSYVFPDPLPFDDVGNDGFVTVGGASIQVRAFFVIAVGFALALLAGLILRRSKLGQGLRAIESDVEAAGLAGVPVTRLIAIAFGLVGGLAGLAAVVAAPSASFGVESGSLLGVKALLAALVVGFSSPIAGFLAGLGVGVVEAGIANFHLAGFELGPAYHEVLPIAFVLVYVAVRAVATDRGPRCARRDGRGRGAVADAEGRRGRGPGRARSGARARRRSPGWCSSPRFCPSLRSASASIVWRATSISRLLRWASGSSSGSAGCLSRSGRVHRSRRAFATAVLETKAGWPTEAAVLAGVVLAALAGGVVGTVAGRLRPALVAVFTWLLAWLVAIGLTAFPSISGGAQGIAVEQGSIAGIELRRRSSLRARRRTDGARRSALLGAPAKPRGRRALGRPPAPSGRGSSGSRWPDCVPRPSRSVPRLRRRPAASVSISPWWPMPQRTGRCSRRSSSSPSCSAEPSLPRAGSSA